MVCISRIFLKSLAETRLRAGRHCLLRPPLLLQGALPSCGGAWGQGGAGPRSGGSVGGPAPGAVRGKRSAAWWVPGWSRR